MSTPFFYVNSERARVGPVPQEEIQSLWNQGSISAGTLVWRTGMGAWKPISQTAEFSAPVPAAPPAPAPVTLPPAAAIGSESQAPERASPPELIRDLSHNSVYVLGYTSGKFDSDVNELAALLLSLSTAFRNGQITAHQRQLVKDALLTGDIDGAKATMATFDTAPRRPAGDAKSEEDTWVCSYCTVINPSDSAQCSVCGGARPVSLLEAEANAQRERLRVEEAASLAAARRLQQQEQGPDAAASGFATCSACTGSLTMAEYLPLGGCSHVYHRGCLRAHILRRIKNKRLPVNCPAESCSADIAESDIKAHLSEAQARRYDLACQAAAASFALNPPAESCCPTPGCAAMFSWTQQRARSSGLYNCAKCHVTYCMNCQVQAPPAHRCAEYQATCRRLQARTNFPRFQPGQQWKQCPFCVAWVKKRPGLNTSIRCKCGRNFCHKCGGPAASCYCYQ